tara:strand:- start:195 stop:317 length:123 start_codon:yes stop_codon:yes gene_type:complete
MIIFAQNIYKSAYLNKETTEEEMDLIVNAIIAQTICLKYT